MKKSILLFATIVSLFSMSCSKDDIKGQNPDPNTEEEETNTVKLRGTATIAGAFQEKSDIPADGEDETIRFEWKGGDKIKFGLVQDGKVPQIVVATITDITADKRSASFSVSLPEEIDGDFTLYVYYGAGSLNPDNPATIILPDGEEFAGDLGSQAKLVSMWDKRDVMFNGETLPELSVSFKHLGSMISLHVENIGTAPITNVAHIELDGTSNWLYNESSRVIFDMSTATFIPDTDGSKGEGSNVSTRIGGTIPVGESRTFYRWFVPGDYESNLQLGLLAKNLTMGTSGSSSMKIRPEEAFETGWNYNFNITMDGYRMAFADVVPKTIITTSTAVGQTIQMRMGAYGDYQSGVWIDLNNNGTRDSGEDPIEFGTVYKNYTIGSQTITIYGNINRLEITQSQLTDVDISNCPSLETINFNTNALTQIDLTYNTKLLSVNVYGNQLTELDVTRNINMHTLYAQTNKLTSLDISKNPLLRYLNLQSNQLSTAEVINSIYNQLPNRVGESQGEVNVRYGGNTGAASADYSIAESKNWKVIYK